MHKELFSLALRWRALSLYRHLSCSVYGKIQLGWFSSPPVSCKATSVARCYIHNYFSKMREASFRLCCDLNCIINLFEVIKYPSFGVQSAVMMTILHMNSWRSNVLPFRGRFQGALLISVHLLRSLYILKTLELALEIFSSAWLTYGFAYH